MSTSKPYGPLLVGVLLLVSSGALGQFPTFPNGPCRDAAFVPIKCLPSSLNVIQEILAPASFVSNSTCSMEQYCGRTQPFEAPLTSPVFCDTCSPGEFSVNPSISDVETRPLVERTRWQSAVFPDTTTAVTFEATLLRPFVLSSFNMEFFFTMPQAMIVERSADFGATFSPYIYFAVDCLARFGIRPSSDPLSIRPTPENPNVVVCIAIPEPGIADGVFYNLRERRIPSTQLPSSVQTEVSIETDDNLRNWLTVTNFRVTLDGVTLPADLTGTNSSFNFYSSYQLVMLGQCECFGHSSGICEAGNVSNDAIGFGCQCEHNTTGLDCGVCRPGFVDVPWRPSRLLDPFECQMCNCNNHADVDGCLFSEERFRATGNTTGGECQNCRDNTFGPQCETCAELFYPQTGVPQTQVDVCIPCDCNAGGVTDNGDCAKMAIGSFPNGQCNCKVNTMGRDCGMCTSTSFNFDANNDDGCTDCACEAAGTVGGSLECMSVGGQCDCKPNVEGRQCDQCMPGFFGLDAMLTDGCQPCDCQFGSSVARDQCDMTSGQCMCRPGFTGRRCDVLMPNYYVPDFDAIRAEAEEQAGVSTVQLPVPPGSSAFEPTGRGFALVTVPNGNLVSFDFVVPGSLLPMRSHTYTVSMRYVLMSSPMSATAQITNISPSPVGSAVALAPLIGNGACASANLGTVAIAACAIAPCPSYTFTVQIMVNPAATIYLDSLVLRPTISSLFASPATDPFLMAFAANNCVDPAPAPAACDLVPPTSVCKPLEQGLNAELFEGARMCSCSVYSVGSDCEDCGGQCTCVNNVVGRACTQCQAGTYNLIASGCQDCECSPIGALSQVCDFTSGECQCRPGRTGRQCIDCMPNYYPNPNNDGSCLPCNCHPIGAVDPQCNMTGFCECNPSMTGITGMQCDMCNCQTQNTVGNSMLCTSDGQCTCAAGSTGLKCENCIQDNFFFDVDDGCQPCMCNSHAQMCNMSGCINCMDNTGGQSCELCLDGFYGDATGGTPADCQPCMCNTWSTTCEANPAANDGFRCNNCQGNTVGDQCQECMINHFGSPINGVSACQDCSPGCNNNIDPATPNSCDSTTGECLICIRDTTGPTCGQCAPLFFGDATILNGCQDCACNPTGSSNLTCDPSNGTCSCYPNVINRQCTVCAPETFGFDVGEPGCEPCGCDPTGSVSQDCELTTGQCTCRTNVIGVQCDMCAPDHFGFSLIGCQPCNCNIDGTIRGNTSCAVGDGMCICEENTIGRQCDQCEPGSFFVTGFGCSQCPCNGRSEQCTDAGICMNCRGNSFGDNCELCQDGFYNDTSSNPLGVCQPCMCNLLGSVNNVCDRDSGQCTCRMGVDSVNSRTCAVCADGFFGLTSAGCQDCDCQLSSPAGSANNTCEKTNGQCPCFENFGARRCDECTPGFYDFPSGCPDCNCDPTGSSGSICNVVNGSCPCRENVVNRRCDECALNTFGFSVSGCTPCGCNSTGSAQQDCNVVTGDCRCRFGIGNSGSGDRELCNECQDEFYGFSENGCLQCECNATTSRSLVCDKNGGQCDCHVNIVGRTCNRCIDDHVVFVNGSGCSACPCNMVGSVQTACNRTNGVCPVMCYCRENIQGCFCDECNPQFNVGGFPDCEACNCSVAGSINGTCNTTGDCFCRNGAFGTKCDQCEENFFMTGVGCMECPECYGEVRDKVVSVRMRLEVLRILIDNLLASELLTSDPPVVTRLSTLLQQACDLLDDTAVAETTDPRIRREIMELQQNISFLDESVTNLVLRVRPIRISAGAARGLVLSSEIQINETVDEVRDAYNNTVFVNGPLLTEGVSLLNDIIDLRATLTGILQTIATTAADLRTVALQLETNAASAASVAATALTYANSALSTGRTTEYNLERLRNDTADAPDVLAIAGQARDAAYRASMLAMDQLTRAQALLPNLDLSGDSATIVAQAQFAVELMNRSQELDAQIQENCARAQTYYELLSNFTGEITDLQPDAFALYERAAQAQQTAQGFSDRVNYIISTATTARDVLDNFEAETNAARSRVETSLQQVDDLRNRSNVLQNAAQALIDSHADALLYAQQALQTVNTALNISQAAANTAMEALTATSSILETFQNSTEDLNTNGRQGVEDKRAAANASRVACEDTSAFVDQGYAAIQAQETVIQNATATATAISTRAQVLLSDLANIGTLPDARLLELTGEFEALQSQLSDAQVDYVVSTLTTLIAQQRGRLTTYRATMATLEADINVVAQARDTLSSTCPVV